MDIYQLLAIFTYSNLCSLLKILENTIGITRIIKKMYKPIVCCFLVVCGFTGRHSTEDNI
jgi:hypothetical protein